MLVAVRHGRTDLNAEESGKERLRGWMDIPLSQDGHQDSMRAASELKKWGIPVDNYYTSNLRRAVQTGESITAELNHEFEPTAKLRDWNVGELTGMTIDDTLDDVHNYMDHPNTKVPGGESYNEFYNRITPFLKDLVESPEGNMVVTHNRVMTLLKAIAANKGGNPRKDILKKKGPVEPGGILMIEPDWNMTILHNHGKSKS